MSKKVELKRVQMYDVISSVIATVGYNSKTNKMYVIFNGNKNKAYIYNDVSKKEFESFLNSESKGQYFNIHFKGSNGDFADTLPIERFVAQPLMLNTITNEIILNEEFEVFNDRLQVDEILNEAIEKLTLIKKHSKSFSSPEDLDKFNRILEILGE